MAEKNLIIAVGVVIIHENKLLIAKRLPDKAMANKWEFPGGKLEENETLEECAIREIKEELCIDVEIDDYLGYEDLPGKHDDYCLHIYTAKLLDDKTKIFLTEHSEYAWVFFDELSEFDLPAFDLPFIKKLRKLVLSSH